MTVVQGSAEAARARLAAHGANEARVAYGPFAEADGSVVLRVGDSVTHSTFGYGVIFRINPGINYETAHVIFDLDGVKELALDIAPLQKVTARESKITWRQKPRTPRPRLDSPLEEAFYDAMPETMRAAVTTQHVVGRYRLDFAFVDEMLCVEVDGRSYHSKDEAFTRDRSRDRWLMANGWRVVRFASDEVFSDAKRCVAEVTAMRENR